MLNSRSTKQLRLAAAALVVIGLSALPGAPAHASGTAASVVATPASVANIQPAAVKVSASAIKKMRAKWKTYRVSKKTQDKLIAKLKAGKRWDSLKPTAKAKKTKTWTSGRFKVKVWTFADGSIIATKRQIPKAPASTASMGAANLTASGGISQCVITRTQYSITVTDCFVSADHVIGDIHMRVDYGTVHESSSRNVTSIYRAYDQGLTIPFASAQVSEPFRASDQEFHLTLTFSSFLGTDSMAMIVKTSGYTDLSVTTRRG